jgi:hypothetical protein
MAAARLAAHHEKQARTQRLLARRARQALYGKPFRDNAPTFGHKPRGSKGWLSHLYKK